MARAVVSACYSILSLVRENAQVSRQVGALGERYHVAAESTIIDSDSNKRSRVRVRVTTPRLLSYNEYSYTSCTVQFFRIQFFRKDSSVHFS